MSKKIRYFPPGAQSGYVVGSGITTSIPEWLDSTMEVANVTINFQDGTSARYELEPNPVTYTVEWRAPKSGERYLDGETIITATFNHSRPVGVIVEESK